jgi:hypothetical protein
MVTMTSPADPSPEDPQEHRDDDEVFRQIVAGFGQEPDEAVPRWPVSEDVTEERTHGPELEALDIGGLRDRPELEAEALPGWLEPGPVEDDGHYVPPPPPRLPRLRLRTVGAVALLVAGLAVLLLPYRIGLDDTTGSLLLGMLLVIGGGLLLIGSMRDAPGSDDRPDDGAVV